MKTTRFERRIELDSDSDAVFAWHERPGAFERLAPPWDRVTLSGPAAAITPDATQVIKVPVGPFRMSWKSLIRDVRAGEEFTDVQVSGPFARWEHRHRVEPGPNGGSFLNDSIEYALPLGALGKAVAGGFVERNLTRLFNYRHRITMQDLKTHANAANRTLDILITGSSGLVGSALVPFLTTGGHRVRTLVRRKPRNENEIQWDPEVGALDPKELEGLDAVVHLAGEGIANKRWTPTQKERIRSSRVRGTRLLVDALSQVEDKPDVFVSAAAIGIYGDRGDELVNEKSEHGTGFLADVCKAWEAEAARLAEVRTVQLRFGVILSGAGGALARMLLPFKIGAGGKLGTGKQWMSWVVLDDTLAAIHHALFCDELTGPVNVVAPEPVRNEEFTSVLGRVLRRPTIAPMPALAARLVFGELANELLLAGQRVEPKRLLETGFTFAFPNLEDALRHQLGRLKKAG